MRVGSGISTDDILPGGTLALVPQDKSETPIAVVYRKGKRVAAQDAMELMGDPGNALTQLMGAGY